MLYLIKFYPVFMKFILLVIMILLIFNFKYIISQFKKLNKKTWIILFIIFFAGLIIRLFLVSHTHYVYFDEFEYTNLAQNILYSNKFCSCQDGSSQYCESCTIIPVPPGYHVFLSQIFGIFGDSEKVAFNTNAIIGSLSIILMFLLIFLTTKNYTLSLIGSFILNFIPVHLKYSGASTLGIISLFFVLLSMVFLEIYIRTKKYGFFLLFLTTLLYTIQIRSENFLLIFIFSFYLLIKLNKFERKNLLKKEYVIPAFIFLFMLIPLIQIIYYGSITNPSPGWNYDLLTKFYYIKKYFISNFSFFTNYQFNLIILPILSVFGCINLYLKDKKQLIYYCFFFLSFLLIYSSYFIGHFENSPRYSLIFYVPLIMMSINGVKFILKHSRLKKIIISLIILLLLVNLVPTKDFILSKSSYEDEYNYILSMEEKLPSNVYIISYNPPSIITTINKKAITPHRFINKLESSNKEKNVILFKDFWWYKNINKSKNFEKQLKEKYSFKLIENNSKYQFYNLTLK